MNEIEMKRRKYLKENIKVKFIKHHQLNGHVTTICLIREEYK